MASSSASLAVGTNIEQSNNNNSNNSNLIGRTSVTINHNQSSANGKMTTIENTIHSNGQTTPPPGTNNGINSNEMPSYKSAHSHPSYTQLLSHVNVSSNGVANGVYGNASPNVSGSGINVYPSSSPSSSSTTVSHHPAPVSVNGTASATSTTNKQLVEHAKNAIAQAAQELAAQAVQQQQQHQQQQFQYHASNSYGNAMGLNVISPSTSDISPSDGSVAPYPVHDIQQQRYATLASFQSQQQQHHQQQSLHHHLSHPNSQQQQGHSSQLHHSPYHSHPSMHELHQHQQQQLSPHSPPPTTHSGSASNQAFAQVLVANLPATMTQSELSDIFSSLPSYERCGIAVDPLTGLSIGRGWLVFSSTEHANHAIAKMNGLTIGGGGGGGGSGSANGSVTNTAGGGGHVLHLSMMQPIGESTKSNIYVAGLPKQYTQTQLEQLFQTFGTIIESKILTDTTGLSRGVAFVRSVTPPARVLRSPSCKHFDFWCLVLIISLSLSSFLSFYQI